MRRVLMISPLFRSDSTASTQRLRLMAPPLPACDWETVGGYEPLCRRRIQS